MKLAELDALLEKGEKLKRLLEGNPEIAAFASALRECRDPVLVIEQDRLVRAGEAAKILGCNQNTVNGYVCMGKLTAWYTPGSTQRKYKLSEVWALARKA
ncbi:MAG: hypothetical protein IJ849_01375 [Selenomonadaceae bacterium]|nr:hypothetical protein [Selenomonadaceae bacterium]